MSLRRWVHLHPPHIRLQAPGVDVDAGAGTGEGVLDVVEDNIPSSSTSATNLVIPRTGRLSRRRVSVIYILRTLVRYVHLPLSTPIERTG